MATTTIWDVFISHASEDKDAVARPLARLLEELGFKVWLDESELTIGDKLRQAIDNGLIRSRWGIVILSPHFFAKAWPQSELDGLFAREADGEQVILPVWHQLSAKDVVKYSPLLAARLAANTSLGIENVAKALARSMNFGSALLSQSEALHQHPGIDIQERLTQLQSNPSGLEDAKIEQYWLQEFVGRGGTGAVYRATNVPLGQTVCMKIFYPLDADHATVTKATERGIRGLAALRNPYITTILDYGFVPHVTQITPYVVCDFVHGRPLDVWSRDLQDHESALRLRLDVGVKLATALSAAHSCTFVGALGFQESGVFHGDIKPSNILITSGNEPVILDFMMPDLQRLTNTKIWSNWEKDGAGRYHYEPPLTAQYGTPGFMPPEQEVDGIIIPQSDIYSLGKTFRDLFWPSSTDLELALSAHKGEFEGALLDLHELIIDMTKSQPTDRINSMETVATELQQISVAV